MTGTFHPCDLPEIGSTDFFNQLALQTDSESALPLAATWELTTRCNLRCRHCYLPPPSCAQSELSLRNGLRLLDTLAEHDVLFLLMTGGEFTLHPHWPELYRHARECGFLVTLMTNATRVDDKVIRELSLLPPRRIEATMYGFTSATYDLVTGIPGSHAQFQASLVKMRQAGLPVEIKMLVLQSNAHELDMIRQWTEDEGLPFRYDAIVNPRLDGDLSPSTDRISPDILSHWLKNKSTKKSDSHDPSAPLPPGAPLFTCGAGIQTLHLDSTGLAHPCMMWRWDPFDTQSDGWALNWKQHIARVRQQPAPETSRCGTCRHRLACFTCPALSRLETGTAGMPVNYFCQLMENLFCGKKILH